MKIDKSTIEKIAHLSRLYFDENGEEKMLKSMNEIIEWVDKLSEVDTDGVEPLTHMTMEQDIMREDVPHNALTREEGMKNAPDHDDEYFKVPKVLD
ncbi:Asp-tRNA(Asn)/Glu-tRNA(Gln) amidotransferase subunit GatC [Flexithrix dorotheae]|uniref:Asp-tRNA(Asn)/Glu-tRNA(Gln) amidotransferase subunit GatC n=1 Tax=Flexithrix dorotheae TaxID=70993 RepID=UPI000382D9C8|nr:Asp-tRNA(Asn)/Glu-tRNA(Gln) amidotransferase subunit GatC [Flexithrix dorotheae]